MNKLDYCYHMHTFRCGHADGTDEEILKAAISKGFVNLGFSDHVMLPDYSQPGIRGDYDQLHDYLKSVHKLKIKYQDKINLNTGLEAEWYGDKYYDYYKELLESGKVDYLILGHHGQFFGDEILFFKTLYDKENSLYLYEKGFIEGLESNLFLYGAHPDLFMQWYLNWDEKAEKVAHHIGKVAHDLDIPLEINMGPSRWDNNGVTDDGELDVPYPNPKFWDIMKEEKVTAVIGVDAHHPYDFDISNYEWAIKFAEKHTYKLLTKEELANRLK